MERPPLRLWIWSITLGLVAVLAAALAAGPPGDARVATLVIVGLTILATVVPAALMRDVR
jgi:hypothetical protein